MNIDIPFHLQHLLADSVRERRENMRAYKKDRRHAGLSALTGFDYVLSFMLTNAL
ncbi:hypothetical protein B4119_1409 [Parageobacillus caldoxylosilyticus]|uniref:Uncharacterized protein n=1 Tax=Saccharococcus caldoxylosilyticus TaxID=81408 RepID=A0A150M4L8_9BACL|nr:hypothetical protein B4119_1409 [Parageobacillus caldoxylosilyticus]